MSNAGRNCLDKREVSAIVQNMLENLGTKCCRLVVIAPVTPIENRMIAVHIEFFLLEKKSDKQKTILLSAFQQDGFACHFGIILSECRI